MNKIKAKLKSKDGAVDMVVILISIIIFASVGMFYVKTVTGSSSEGTGINGASKSVNNVILNNVP